jgi:hypothetical protein
MPENFEEIKNVPLPSESHASIVTTRPCKRSSLL